MGMSGIFNGWSIIFTFLFNMGRNLSGMEKRTVIREKTSIITGKMSIIPPVVQHPFAVCPKSGH
nr:hypothetical protein [Bacillaceae bacterium]